MNTRERRGLAAILVGDVAAGAVLATVGGGALGRRSYGPAWAGAGQCHQSLWQSGILKANYQRKVLSFEAKTQLLKQTTKGQSNWLTKRMAVTEVILAAN
jgi:hypothetical protein